MSRLSRTTRITSDTSKRTCQDGDRKGSFEGDTRSTRNEPHSGNGTARVLPGIMASWRELCGERQRAGEDRTADFARGQLEDHL